MNQSKNIIIGLFVLAAIAILVFILIYLHPSVGDMGRTLHVRFTNIDKINVGTRVNLGGKPVGEVVAIAEVPEARTKEIVPPGQVAYIYELTLKVDSHVKIFRTDRFSITTSGLLGERSIEITPLAPAQGLKLVPVTSQDILYSESSPSIEEVVNSAEAIAKKVEKALDIINDQLSQFAKGKVMDKITKTAKNLEEITTAVNKPAELADIVKNLHQTTHNFLDVSDKVAKGEGSIGKLLARDDFYLRLTSVMSKGDMLMDDINHYGLLFQNNKNWQRLRARRLNLIDKLSSPQEFRNYFNDEIDQITSSLSRVNRVLEEAGICMPNEVVTSKEFAKVFAELLLRVKTLEENLFLYDQQVVDIRNQEMYNGVIPEGDLCDPICQPPMPRVICPSLTGN
jgi:phospholipid/cholesterol/gamma-HCH transport system substrate-binding protein